MNDYEYPPNQVHAYQEGKVQGVQRSWEQLTIEWGFVLGVAKAIQQGGGSLARRFDSDMTHEIVKKEPTLLVLTHTYGYEVFSAIGGLCDPDEAKFRDLSLVAEATPGGSWLHKYVLPLYNVDAEKPSKLLPRLNRIIHPKTLMPRVNAIERNAWTLRGLAKLSVEKEG